MRWLSRGGVLAALVVGRAVTAATGPAGLALLFAFFLSSSALTPGGGRRTAIQVAANGGIATLGAVLSAVHPVWRLAFAGALAAAAADTWSTEIGGRSRAAPRLITTRASVSPGTSGGVTLLGSLGGAAGAAFIAVAAAILGLASWRGAAGVAVAGVLGGLADSVLGATVQARYRCPACGAFGETPRHACGAAADLVGGAAWVTNDTVNLAATAVGAALAVLPALLGVPVAP